MANCPSCKAEVDLEADLCLSCGEPLGDSPAANLARSQPASDGRVRATGAAPAARATIAESPAARRRRVEEPETVRCPGCGSPSRAERCPGCGVVLRRDEP